MKINGVFGVYKPRGITSATLCNEVKRLLGDNGSNKIGHGGTLDNFAEGIMCIGVNKGCKLLPSLLNGSKRYEVACKLGSSTETYGPTGLVTHTSDYDHVNLTLIHEKLKRYKGLILQKPPIYSALKYRGQRLSDIARNNPRALPTVHARPVEIHGISVLDIKQQFITLELSVGSGFYVRSFVDEFGKDLGTHSHVHTLTRTSQGPFTAPSCKQWINDANDWDVGGGGGNDCEDRGESSVERGCIDGEDRLGKLQEDHIYTNETNALSTSSSSVLSFSYTSSSSPSPASSNSSPYSASNSSSSSSISSLPSSSTYPIFTTSLSSPSSSSSSTNSSSPSFSSSSTSRLPTSDDGGQIDGVLALNGMSRCPRHSISLAVQCKREQMSRYYRRYCELAGVKMKSINRR